MFTLRKKVALILIILFAVILAISSIVRYFFMDPVSTNLVLIELGFEMFTFQYELWNYAMYTHIFSAAIALLVGPIQFIKKFRTKNLALHRNLGKLYVISIAISASVGMYLSFYAFGGLTAMLGFFFLDIAWIITTYLAYYYIRKRNVHLHEQWMYRSYAVTFAAVTFRIWSAIIGYSTDNFILGYALATWLCWIGNLIVIEGYIRKKGQKQLTIEKAI
ncbi:DUF2306 domain-containing protein [Evansella sp. AB-rgal1]|uniref:DUF2306 domain-containing protein n=1 Tax=Evansella sp. AB-rgal1 TaxID=3242696 RepID=UPI00359E6741